MVVLHRLSNANSHVMLRLLEDPGIPYVAYTKGAEFQPASRRDPECIIDWNAW